MVLFLLSAMSYKAFLFVFGFLMHGSILPTEELLNIHYIITRRPWNSGFQGNVRACICIYLCVLVLHTAGNTYGRVFFLMQPQMSGFSNEFVHLLPSSLK